MQELKKTIQAIRSIVVKVFMKCGFDVEIIPVYRLILQDKFSFKVKRYFLHFVYSTNSMSFNSKLPSNNPGSGP